MMTPVERYIEFAIGFEQSRKIDDWASVARRMSDDAVFVYPLESHGGGLYEGRAAFLLHHALRERLFNRRFEHSDLGSWGVPVLSGDDTVIHAVYGSWRAPGRPDLAFEFELHVSVEDELVVRVEEVWEPKMSARIRDYLAEHGAALGCSLDALDLAPSRELQLLRGGMQLIERSVTSRNQIASWQGPIASAQQASAQCRSTWRGPGMPDLHLEYGLEYGFAPGGRVDVDVDWEPAMRDRLKAHLAAHGEAIRKQAAAR